MQLLIRNFTLINADNPGLISKNFLIEFTRHNSIITVLPHHKLSAYERYPQVLLL